MQKIAISNLVLPTIAVTAQKFFSSKDYCTRKTLCQDFFCKNRLEIYSGDLAPLKSTLLNCCATPKVPCRNILLYLHWIVLISQKINAKYHQSPKIQCSKNTSSVTYYRKTPVSKCAYGCFDIIRN